MVTDIEGRPYIRLEDYLTDFDASQTLELAKKKIAEYEKRSKNDRLWHNILGITVIVLGGLSSVVAAITGLSPIVGVGVGAAISVIGGIVAFAKFKEWTRWRYFANKLKKEMDDFLGDSGDYHKLPKKEDKEALFRERVWSIIFAAEPESG